MGAAKAASWNGSLLLHRLPTNGKKTRTKLVANMDYREWEFFETEVKSDTYHVVDHGPLLGPVTSFKIRRDDRLKLVLETTSVASQTADASYPAPNAVYRLDGQVRLQGRYTGFAVTAHGVSPGGYNSSYRVNEASSTRVQTSTVQSLHWATDRGSEGRHVIDWVGNLSGSFLWPDSDNVEETDVKTRTLRSPTGDIVIPSTSTSSLHDSSCARLSIGGWDVIIGQLRGERAHIDDSGFVLYLGLPDEETRSRIRGCLSFCLGDYLVYLGSTTFDATWEPVSFLAVAAHALADKARDISGRPPAPLGLNYQREVNATLLSRMASGLFGIYEAYDLRNAFWNYWHGLAAPVHMVAAHFGAAIEALQKAHFANSGGSTHNRIVASDDAWKALLTQIDRCIQDFDVPAAEKQMLRNKASNLNSAPQAVVADRFFASVGLQLSALEKDVWINRNRAAHGGSVTDVRAIQTIRENKVLMMLMSRVLLSIGQASDLYYDYYTLDRPTRQLCQPVPDDRPPRVR